MKPTTRLGAKLSGIATVVMRWLHYLPVLAISLSGFLLSNGGFAQAPEARDFQRVMVAEGLDLPMEFEIAPDGRVFIVSKCGGLYAWHLDSGSPVQTATVPNVRCVFEDGLLSVALDPQFIQNHHIYFQYTAPGSLTRVSRFVVNADNSLDVASESVLLEWRTGNEAHGHMGGSLKFDLDGNLLISTGDNQAATGYFAPAAQATSGNTNDLRGKILRITPTAEGGYTIPAGNLFAGDAQHRPEIYGMGFRNPFRINLDPQTGYFYTGDIGPDASSASEEGPGGMDEIHEIRTAGNYGWPWIVGFNQPYAGFDPLSLSNSHPDNTGSLQIPNAIPAIWTIRHQATMVGPVYRINESIQHDHKLPAYYDGKLIFWDFNSSRFFTLDIASPQTPLVAVDMPLNTTGFQGAIDVELDPRTHQLYVLQWGSGCCDKEPYGGGALYRFDYIGDRNMGDNLAMSATVEASSHNGIHIAENVLDGNPETRWQSQDNDPEWLTITLQQPSVLRTLVLTWEAAYSARYIIEGSSDGISWDLLVEENHGAPGVILHQISAQTAYRFIRLTGLERGTPWGHSLFEFEIYGDDNSPPAELTEFAYLNMPRTLDASFTGVPRLLSETGVFSNTPDMTPQPHMLPFIPNSPLWSDGADKLRWLSLPAQTTIEWDAKQNWVFPEGTVAVKTFELPLDSSNPAVIKRLETRLLVMKADGRVYGVTYKWRADNSDADLLMDSLFEPLVSAHGNQTWAYPSPTECIDCHTPSSAQILGVNTRQLNGNYPYANTGIQNQLVHWNNRQLFSPAFDSLQVAMLDKMVAITDESATLENRIKSYLDANCAHCHGTGQGGSQWDSRYNTPLSHMKIVGENTTGIRNYLNDYGIVNAKVVAPGDPQHSILYIRDKSESASDRMPPIGRLMEHEDYIAVLERWISSLGDMPPTGEKVLISAGKPVATSSEEVPFIGSNVVDSNPATRWSSLFNDDEWIEIDLQSVQAINEIVVMWEAAYGVAYVIEGSVDQANWQLLVQQNAGQGGTERYDNLSGAYRYIRLTGQQRATVWGYSLFELQIWGEGSSGTPGISTLLSRGKAVTTSDIEGGYVGSNATDGNATTRWSSVHEDNQFIQIDLGTRVNVDRILLNWEAAFGSGYFISLSDNEMDWQEIYRTTDGQGGIETLDVNGAGRYIRLTGTDRATPYGFSLWEFEVYGYADGVVEPQITVLAPAANQVFVENSAVNVQVGVNPTSWFSSGGAWRYQLNNLPQVTVSTGTSIALDTLAVGDHQLHVALLDNAGNTVGAVRTVNFSVVASGGSGGPLTPPVKLSIVGVEASSEGPVDRAINVIDGNPASRWDSAAEDPQYIILDAGENVYFTRAVLNWEAAYGRSYTLDVSVDGINWQTAYGTTSGRGGIEDITLDGQRGRYLRMYGVERATGYGYSLYSFDAYGLPADPAMPFITIVSPAAESVIANDQPVSLQIDITDSGWIANGGAWQYSLNNGPVQQLGTMDAVSLGVLPTGPHSLRISLVNSEGVAVGVPKNRTFNVSCGNQCPNILVFSKTAGFRHDSIPAGIAMVQQIAAEHGYSLTFTEDASLFTETNLAQYSTVVFMNTTGDVFNTAQETAFRAYIENGGGYVGAHAAADTEHDWYWYTDVLFAGAEFIHHGDGIPHARVDIEQPHHHLMNHMGTEWFVADEWYFWKSNPRGVGNINVLANLDRSSYASNYPVEDHPIIFTNQVGQGRMFYTAAGHVDANFTDPKMIEKFRKAIEWTSGL